VLRTVKNCVLKNYGIVNVYRINLNNVGYFYYSPHLYFDELKGEKNYIFDYKSQNKPITQNWIDQVCDSSSII